eukprot:evm.model.NODE_26177_length_1158_cov_16.936960.1
MVSSFFFRWWRKGRREGNKRRKNQVCAAVRTGGKGRRKSDGAGREEGREGGKDGCCIVHLFPLFLPRDFLLAAEALTATKTTPGRRV